MCASAGCSTSARRPRSCHSAQGLSLTGVIIAGLACLSLVQAVAKYVDEAALPEFVGAIQNVTVALGRDAHFTCSVRNLGNFRVGWVKADSKAIQAIHDAVITHNSRVTVSGDWHSTFNLHISTVQEEDKGHYMCQINTDPMSYQTAVLDVMVPPDIVQSSGDRELQQGETAKLECRADGYPVPTISWKREGSDLPIKALGDKGVKQLARFEGTTLVIPKVTPEDMGAYLCIARNEVPPARSKRLFLYVQFAPKLHAKQQLVGAGFGKDVTLECEVRGYPKPIVYWNFTGGIVVSGGRFEVTEKQLSESNVSSRLVIHKASLSEMGKYECVAKNSLGVAETVVRVYMVATPSPSSASAASSPLDSAFATPTALAPVDSAPANSAFDADDRKTGKRRKDAGPEYDVSGNAHWFAANNNNNNNNNNGKSLWSNDVVASSAGAGRGCVWFGAVLGLMAARWA